MTPGHRLVCCWGSAEPLGCSLSIQVKVWLSAFQKQLSQCISLWGRSPAASWPRAANLHLQMEIKMDSACLIQGAVASGPPEQAGRDTQCRGSDLLPGALEAGC